MVNDLHFDLTQDIPNVNIKTHTGTIVLSLMDIYEYALMDAEQYTSLKDRMPKITKKFNDDNDCNLTEKQLYLVLFKGLEASSSIMGN